MKQAIISIRCSTPGQFEEGHEGAELQENECRAWCEQNGYEVVEVVADCCSRSSDPTMREGFGRILNDATRPPIDAVVVWKTDRVSSDMRYYFEALLKLERNGVELISVNEDFGVDPAIANLLRSVMVFVANREKENITMRTKPARLQKAAKGNYSGGGVPFGYRQKGKNGELTIYKSEAEIVRQIYALRQAGETIRAIADTVKLSKSGVDGILKNSIYQGIYTYGGVKASRPNLRIVED